MINAIKRLFGIRSEPRFFVVPADKAKEIRAIYAAGYDEIDRHEKAMQAHVDSVDKALADLRVMFPETKDGCWALDPNDDDMRLVEVVDGRIKTR